MTIPAKYTLTEAHFIIAELERKVADLELTLTRVSDHGHQWEQRARRVTAQANAMVTQVDELTEQRIELNHRVAEMERRCSDLKDATDKAREERDKAKRAVTRSVEDRVSSAMHAARMPSPVLRVIAVEAENTRLREALTEIAESGEDA